MTKRILLSTILLFLTIFIGSASADKIDASENHDTEYCHEPRIKVVRMKDYTYRAYYCGEFRGDYFEIYHKDRKIHSERIKEGDFSIDENMSAVLSGRSLLPPLKKDIMAMAVPR
jgi:hypothetical protein